MSDISCTGTAVGMSWQGGYENASHAHNATAFPFLRCLVLALLLSAGVYGAFVAQCLRYATYFRGKDRILFRVSVPILVLLNTLSVVLNAVSFVQVIHKALGPAPFSANFTTLNWISVFLLRTIATINSVFFLMRVQGLYPSWVMTTIGVSMFAVLQVVYIPYLVYEYRAVTNLGLVPKAQLWRSIGLWWGLLFELYISIVLLLRRHKIGEIKLRPQHDPVLRTLGTALGTSAILIPVLIAAGVLSTIPNNPAVSINQVIIAQVWPPLSSLCVVHALNQRRRCASGGAGGAAGTPQDPATHDPATWRGDHPMQTRSPLNEKTQSGMEGRAPWDDDRVLVNPDGTFPVSAEV